MNNKTVITLVHLLCS